MLTVGGGPTGAGSGWWDDNYNDEDGVRSIC